MPAGNNWLSDVSDAVVALSSSPDGRVAVAGAEGSVTLLPADGEIVVRQQLSLGCLAVAVVTGRRSHRTFLSI